MTPRFSPGAARVLDELEGSPSNDNLVDAIWDTIDLICSVPLPAAARRRALRTEKGHSVWLVPVRFRHGEESWVVLWQPKDDEVLVAYIGPEDFRPVE